jgi:transcriptional regulator with XRE-family HTH domain
VSDPPRDAPPDVTRPARPEPRGQDSPVRQGQEPPTPRGQEPPTPRGQEPLWRDVLGEHLRALRHARGETLAETAGRAGVSPQYLSEVERGVKEPSSEMIAALAGALDTTLVDLTAGVAERLKVRSAVRTTQFRSRRRGPHAAMLCLSSMTRSMSPYPLAASAVKTRSWSVSARSRSMSWLVCRESMRSMSVRTRTTSSA